MIRHHRLPCGDRVLHLVEHAPVGDHRDGPCATAVLVHGYVLAGSVFAPVARRLAQQGVRVLCPDLAGHGWSTAGSGPLELSDLAADLAAVVRALGPPSGHQLVVLGHSMGGMVTMRMLTDHPDVAGRVTGLVWLGTSAGGMRTSPFGLPVRWAPVTGPFVSRLVPLLMARAAARTPDEGPRPRALARAVERRHLGRSNFSTRPSSVVMHHVQALHHRVPHRVLESLLRSILEHDERTALATAACPALVLVGEDDRMTPVAHSREIAAVHPGARLRVLPSAGHLAMLEQPDAVADAVLELLAPPQEDRCPS